MESPIVFSIVGILLFAAGATAGMAWADAKREGSGIDEADQLRWERRELLTLLERYTTKLKNPIGATGSANPGGSESNPCAQWMPAAATYEPTSAGLGQGD